MQTATLWIIGALVILGGGYFLFSGSNTSEEMVKDVGTKGGEMMEGDTQKDAMVKDESMTKDEGATMEKGGDAMMEDGATMEKPEGAMTEKGSYEPYAPEKLARANSGDVVLFFNASWCPFCRAADADIRAHLSAIPPGLTILSVDYDNSQSLKQKYGVTYQHTFVQVSADGSLIKKWSGSETLAALVAEVQ